MQGYVPETRFSLVSVDVIRQNVDGNTRLLFGNDFCLISVDEFRLRGDGNTRFCSRNTFFSCFLYISDSFSTRYSWSSFSIGGQVNMLWSCGFIWPIPDFYRPFVKSMLHYVKSHIHKSYILFTASINLFYSSSFLQSIDR